MSLLDRFRMSFSDRLGRGAGPLVEARFLDVPTGDNYRDLGGYDSPHGPTRYRRFVRAGSTARLSFADVERLKDYGVCRVLDLRSAFEEPRSTDRFVRQDRVAWENVPLFDYDLSDPRLAGTSTPAGNYLIDGYVTMLSNHEAIRRIFEFFAQTPDGGAVLFHCAAGMDRTGMVALLLLGLAEVPRAQVVADYLYSFASKEEVDRLVFEKRRLTGVEGAWSPLPSREEAVEFVLDRIEQGYGTTRAYLAACGINGQCLDSVRGMLVGHEGSNDRILGDRSGCGRSLPGAWRDGA